MFGKNDKENELRKITEEKKKSLFVESEDDNLGENNYIQGAVGSLVGALLGSVIWFLIGMVGFYASIAGYAIAFCAFKGYQLMKGKLTRVAVVINIVAMLIAFLAVNYLSYFYAIHKEVPDLTLKAFGQVLPIIIREPEVLREICLNLGLGLLFMLLGSYRTIKECFDFIKKKEEKNNVQDNPVIEDNSSDKTDSKESE